MHITQDGRSIRLKDLSDNHLNNIIRKIERKAKEGCFIRSGGGFCPEDYWYDEEQIYGDEVLDYFDYDYYMDEKKRRAKLSKSAQVTAPHAGGEKKPKRYSFKAYRITNGCKVPVEEKGLFFCPVEDDNGGYLSFFEWMGIERDKAITGKHNDAYYRMLEEELKRARTELEVIKNKLEIHKDFMDELFSNLVGK